MTAAGAHERLAVPPGLRAAGAASAGSALPDIEQPVVLADLDTQPSDRHWVSAVLIVANGERWLPRTLRSLQALDRPADQIIAVDASSTDRSADILQSAGGLIDHVVTLPQGSSFGQAVSTAVSQAAVRTAEGSQPGDATQSWLWLLHDDSAPEPDALAQLLAEADRSASAGVLGPKVRGWHDPGLLVECGLSITNSGRRFTGFDPGERDQGQRDDLSDVLAVGSAGMLVRAELWEELGGFDPALPSYGDDIEFCMRARRADHRVLVVPSAVIHHREAGLHGQRSTSEAGPLAMRAAGLYTTLVHGPALALPFTSALLFLRTLASAILLLPGAGPRRAWAELGVWLKVHAHPLRVVGARRRLRQVAKVPRREVRALRPRLTEQWGTALERSMLERRSGSPAGSRARPVALGTATGLALGLAAVAAVATSSAWSGSGLLQGGALLPAADGGALWSGFRSSWHDVGLGSGEAAAPYLVPLVLLAAIPGLSTDTAVSVLLLGTVPLAGFAAFLSLRGLPQRSTRAALAIAYALVPAAVVPSLDGRLGTAVLAVLLPWLARLLVRVFADCSWLPAPRARTAAVAALLLAVCAAFAPLVWPAVGIIVLVAAVVRTRSAVGWLRVAIILGGPVALLWPWSGAVLTDPARAMFEAGASAPDLVAPTPPGWRLLLLDPGTLGATATWVAVPLVALAALALLWGRSRTVGAWGWWIVLVGLAGATLATSRRFVPLGSAEEQFAFAGPMLVVMAVGMGLAAAGLLAAAGAVERRRGRAGATLVVLALVAGPMAMTYLWTTEATGPLQRTDEVLVPAFVTAEAQSADRTRVIVLDQTPGGSIDYALVNGAGPRIGDADVAPPAETWRELSAAVAEVGAGVGPQPVQVLADNAVGYLIADVEDQELAAALDGNSALRRLSTNEGRGLWELAGVTSRARIEQAGRLSPAPIQPIEGSRAAAFDAPTGPAAQLRVAQVDDGRWSATIGDTSLPVAGDLGLTIEIPAGQGSAEQPEQIVLIHDQASRDQALLVPLAALILLALLLPGWRRADRLPDPDRAAEQPAPTTDDLVDITDSAVEVDR